MKHTVTFHASGRGKAQCAPDPAYPNGVHVDGTKPGEKSCLVTLPYPAPECGFWAIECETCGFTMAITAAGRVDDPVSVKVPCADE
jgi:hypothetical protein